MDDDLNEVFKAAKSGMKIILQDKTKWSGTIKSKWGKYFGGTNTSFLDSNSLT